jgi:hypothetical protein
MATTKTRLRYHCVSIVGGKDACAAVKELALQRLLSADAPRLPLATCDRPDACNCRFRHHDDRRAGPRRSTESGRLGGTWTNTERRDIRGRRDSDYEEP